MKKLSNKGFSMVELIIVIAIMAILAGALAPALIKYINKSRLSTDVQTGQTVATAVQTALSNEAAYEDATDVNSPTALSDTVFGGGDMETEFKQAMGNSVPTKGKSKKDIKGTAFGTTQFYVTLKTADSKVEVYYGGTDSTNLVYPTVGSKLAE